MKDCRVTYRQYLTDASFGVLIEDNAVLLRQIADALSDPKWGIWLGARPAFLRPPVLAGFADSRAEALKLLIGEEPLESFTRQRTLSPFRRARLLARSAGILRLGSTHVFAPQGTNSSRDTMRLESNPIPMKERTSMVWLQCGNIEVQDGALVLIDKDGIRTHLPVGGLACIFLEPGTRITHEAVALAAEVGCLIQWVGEGGVRLYSAGQPGGARSDRLLYQAKLALDDDLRIKVVRAMYRFRFQEDPPARRSIEQLRGIEGVRVRTMYKLLAQQHGVPWDKREYDPDKFDASDVVNRCLSVANHCLYGLCEAAILAAGYAPAIGFLHTGKPLSFVYDIADLFKFETSVRIAFKVVAAQQRQSGA